MANLYRGFADALDGDAGAHERFRGIAAGVRGMRFLDAVIESNRDGSVWTELGE